MNQPVLIHRGNGKYLRVFLEKCRDYKFANLKKYAALDGNMEGICLLILP
jgi:hypothetical protein